MPTWYARVPWPRPTQCEQGDVKNMMDYVRACVSVMQSVSQLKDPHIPVAMQTCAAQIHGCRSCLAHAC